MVSHHSAKMTSEEQMKINYYGMDLIYEDNKLESICSSIDPYEWMIADKLIDSGDNVVLAGSGTGSIAALLMGKGCEVTAFEPDFSRRQLSNQYIYRDFEHFSARHEALWIKDGKMFWSDDGFHSKLTSNCTADNKVSTVDTQRILDEVQANSLVLDVEGAEYQIIPHIKTENLKSLIVEVHGDTESIVKSVNLPLVSMMTYDTSHVLGFKRDDTGI